MTLLETLNSTDHFAHTNGIRLTHISEGSAQAEMTVEPRHLNGGGVCQGGALFTLADLAFAAVCQSHGLLTLGINNTINFVNSAKLGDRLRAIATETCDHPKLPVCDIKIYNQDNLLIAAATGQAYRKHAPFPFSQLM